MKKSHHNTSLYCEAQNSAEKTPRRASILLQVEFAPYVTLVQTPGVLKEGDTGVFTCLAQANPGTVTYQWFLAGKEQSVGGNASQLELPGLDRRNNGEIMKCRVTNRVGKSEETQTLNILCKFVVIL